MLSRLEEGGRGVALPLPQGAGASASEDDLAAAHTQTLDGGEATVEVAAIGRDAGDGAGDRDGGRDGERGAGERPGEREIAPETLDEQWTAFAHDVVVVEREVRHVVEGAPAGQIAGRVGLGHAPHGHRQGGTAGITAGLVEDGQLTPGDERLGQTLLAGFLYALTEATPWPDAILFYNGGARWTTADSVALDDLRRLEAGGVQILTCGLCLNHYGLTDALAVGGVTNMYAIAQTLMSADTVIKP